MGQGCDRVADRVVTKTNDQYGGGVVPAISKKGRKAIHIIIVTYINKNVNRKLEKSIDKLKVI